MQKIVYPLGIILILLVAFITTNEGSVAHSETTTFGGETDYETILVAGMERETTVSNEKPLILMVSGNYNVVWVDKDTEVREVVLSGIGNIVYLSSGHHPKLMRSGIQNLVLRYD